MATKVRGDKIKEGSIPLSALAPEVKDKIENAGGGANWNAQKGEAGYIENKPFKDNINNKFDFSAWDAENESNTVITIADTEGVCCIAIKYNESNVEGYYQGQRVILCNPSNEPELYKIRLNGAGEIDVIITYNFDNNEFIIEFDGIGLDFEYDLKNIIWYGLGVYDFSNVITPIDSTYVRDIVKTTPQTLSNADKNQALANLGIEEYFRQIKEKCTLHIQYDELSFDSENPNLVTGYGTGLDNLIKDIKSFIANCYYYNEIGQLITAFGKHTCTEIFCNDLSDVDNATYINISFGTSIFSEACFASQCQIRYENDELLLFYFEL